ESSSDPTYNSSQFSFLAAPSDERFRLLAISINPPTPMVKIPMISTTCGGLRIFTSKPNDSCHQLSKGAEVSMQKPPHAAINAPNGPRNPSTLTEASLASLSPAKVVCRIRYAQERPVRTAPN